MGFFELGGVEFTRTSAGDAGETPPFVSSARFTGSPTSLRADWIFGLQQQPKPRKISRGVRFAQVKEEAMLAWPGDTEQNAHPD
jgi:hypothetical protein